MLARFSLTPTAPLGRAPAAHELAASRRPFREAKRQPLTDDCDVRPRDCVPMHGCVRACSRSTAQQTATTAVGLELGSHDGLDGTIGFDGQQSCCTGGPRDRNATHSVVLPRAADACIPRMMRKPNGARLDVRRRTAAFAGHRAAGLPRRQSSQLGHPDDRNRVKASASFQGAGLLACAQEQARLAAARVPPVTIPCTRKRLDRRDRQAGASFRRPTMHRKSGTTDQRGRRNW